MTLTAKIEERKQQEEHGMAWEDSEEAIRRVNMTTVTQGKWCAGSISGTGIEGINFQPFKVMKEDYTYTLVATENLLQQTKP